MGALAERDGARAHVRLFGSTAFFRLWLTQVVSATGDWLGFLAIAALATRISDRPEAAVGLVMSARIVPGFFLGPAAGVFADSFDRKRLMVMCDVGRALVLASLPFRSEEHTSELQSLMRISSAVFCLKKIKKTKKGNN